VNNSGEAIGDHAANSNGATGIRAASKIGVIGGHVNNSDEAVGNRADSSNGAIGIHDANRIGVTVVHAEVMMTGIDRTAGKLRFTAGHGTTGTTMAIKTTANGGARRFMSVMRTGEHRGIMTDGEIRVGMAGTATADTTTMTIAGIAATAENGNNA
jgi:hypothetical protein